MKMEFEVVERYQINLFDHEEYEWDIFQYLDFNEMVKKVNTYISDHDWMAKKDLNDSIIIFKNLYIEKNKSYLETLEKHNVEQLIKDYFKND